jgi:hypothetical protein
MSTDVTAVTAPHTRRYPLNRKNKVGLVLAGLLALGDLVGPFTVPTPKPGEQGPPMVVLWASAVMGLITVIACIYVWRTGDRVGSRVIAGARILSAATSLPAFFVGDVPAGLVVVAAAGIVLTIIVVGLVLARPAPVARPQ